MNPGVFFSCCVPLLEQACVKMEQNSENNETRFSKTPVPNHVLDYPPEKPGYPGYVMPQFYPGFVPGPDPGMLPIPAAFIPHHQMAMIPLVVPQAPPVMPPQFFNPYHSMYFHPPHPPPAYQAQISYEHPQVPQVPRVSESVILSSPDEKVSKSSSKSSHEYAEIDFTESSNV